MSLKDDELDQFEIEIDGIAIRLLSMAPLAKDARREELLECIRKVNRGETCIPQALVEKLAAGMSGETDREGSGSIDVAGACKGRATLAKKNGEYKYNSSTDQPVPRGGAGFKSCPRNQFAIDQTPEKSGV